MSVVDARPVMRAQGINQVFGATHALRDVDFAVQSGQVTVLFGENGAGKPALMKILAGIESPTTGALELDGEPVVLSGARDAADRGIAMIHQKLSLFPNLSIADNLFMARERVRHGCRSTRPASASAPACCSSAWRSRWTRTPSWETCAWASGSSWRSPGRCCRRRGS